jgi:hypothetical protein
MEKPVENSLTSGGSWEKHIKKFLIFQRPSGLAKTALISDDTSLTAENGYICLMTQINHQKILKT